MRSCDVSNYVNLRWHVSKFETLRSGEVSLSAQFDDHGDYKYFSIDGKTSDYDACCGNPVQQGGTFSGVYSVLCTLERAAGVRQAPAGRKWGRLVASERQPKQPSSCPDTPPTHAVPLLPVWPLTAGPRARLRRKLVTAVVTPVHRCDGCLSDRDKQAS